MPSRKSGGPIDSTTPRKKPPNIAPGMLPMPPSTAALNALMPGRKPDIEIDLLVDEAVEHAADAGHAGAEHEGEDDHLVAESMPISAAASRSSDTARIAIPILVFWTTT